VAEAVERDEETNTWRSNTMSLKIGSGFGIFYDGTINFFKYHFFLVLCLFSFFFFFFLSSPPSSFSSLSSPFLLFPPCVSHPSSFSLLGLAHASYASYPSLPSPWTKRCFFSDSICFSRVYLIMVLFRNILK